MPERIQRRRTAGWRMPEGAVYVGRPTRWGNPFAVGQGYHFSAADGPYYVTKTGVVDSRAKAVDLYRYWLTLEKQASLLADIRHQLAGRDLACWCPLVDVDGKPAPCHADVLLEIATGATNG